MDSMSFACGSLPFTRLLQTELVREASRQWRRREEKEGKCTQLESTCSEAMPREYPRIMTNQAENTAARADHYEVTDALWEMKINERSMADRVMRTPDSLPDQSSASGRTETWNVMEVLTQALGVST
ncbi:hypothetical protein DPEC_G00322730 [Dallia pectoralis]|uniref:Uncharacterized protein n=1 Tax=Dallia pectoralis TaxID=75939 RepID=A0ACC2FA96_DALPE|nr:hypothetical protein DPEC_G00322730 [Dallia pectoralis]